MQAPSFVSLSCSLDLGCSSSVGKIWLAEQPKLKQFKQTPIMTHGHGNRYLLRPHSVKVSKRNPLDLLGLLLMVLPLALVLLLPVYVRAYQVAGQQESEGKPTYLLEPPPASREQFAYGPAVDLVGLNRRRFEHDHEHQSASDEEQLRRGQFIESNLAALPDRLLASLPEEVSHQVLETLATEPALIMGYESAGGPADSLLASAVQDPEVTSIERLSKACLTVHASSSRPEELNVTFHLYTRKNPQVPFLIDAQHTRHQLLQTSPFDPRKPIKWITHGFHTNVDKSEWMVDAKNKILAFEDANVILTDWRRGASPALAFYPKAAANAHVVAKLIVKILRRFQPELDLGRVHLIGHSLGAHIMGFVGSAFTEEYLHSQQQVLMRLATGASDRTTELPVREVAEYLAQRQQRAQMNAKLIGRISACDPALPCFGPSSSAPNSRQRVPKYGDSARVRTAIAATDWTPTMWTHLRPDSAVQVEVMHSNPGVMGYAEPLGDFDFYPNGNDRQPGCGDAAAVEQHMKTTVEKRSGLGNFMGAIWSRVPSFRSRPASPCRSTMRNQNGKASESKPKAGWSNTLDRFIKPLKDFLQSYTCSHHRSVELLVEAMYDELPFRRHRLARSRSSNSTLAAPGSEICQMVGYKCSDYTSFKRGFCFNCAQDSEDCRAFARMSALPAPSATKAHQPISRRSATEAGELVGGDKFTKRAIEHYLREVGSNSERSNKTDAPYKRVLPTYNQYDQLYLAPKRNTYFFDTAPSSEFCLHHYHLLIKYRWFRLRESMVTESFRLIGSLAQLDVVEPLSFHRHSFQTYTLLLTEINFLGPIKSLVLLSDSLRPPLIEYIEVSYLSNLDPRIRAENSARLCRSAPVRISRATRLPPISPEQAGMSVFVHCPV